jgi:cytochrome c biogenesis protein CcmG, thiol:disulfide interchange protein DsbE
MRSGGRNHAIPALLLAGIALTPVRAAVPSASADARTPSAPRAAPDFSRTDLDRGEIRLEAYRGKVVLLNFWATWCEPCIAEIPRFAEWQRKYAGRLQVLGVSMDDEEAPVRAACRKYGLNYPVVMGDEKLAELYGGVLGLPMSFLIDRNGRIRFEHEGAIDLGVIEKEIRELLPRP